MRMTHAQGDDRPSLVPPDFPSALAQPRHGAPAVIPAATVSPAVMPVPPRRGRTAPVWIAGILVVVLAALVGYFLNAIGPAASLIGMLLALIPLAGVLVAACVLLIALGVVAFVVGLSSDPASAWRAFHVNFLYFNNLSMAALCVACALVIVGARWAGPIRHVPESLAAWMPISVVLFVVGNLFGKEYIHQNWLHGAPSIVQCPELCTRGAISLPSRRPS